MEYIYFINCRFKEAQHRNQKAILYLLIRNYVNGRELLSLIENICRSQYLVLLNRRLDFLLEIELYFNILFLKVRRAGTPPVSDRPKEAKPRNPLRFSLLFRLKSARFPHMLSPYNVQTHRYINF